MALIGQNNRHSEAMLKQVKQYINDLKLQPVEGIESCLNSEDQGNSIIKLFELIGSRLMKQHPDLINYYQAGLNLNIDATRNHGHDFNEILLSLNLPDELLFPQKDKLKWANQVHAFFEWIILEKNA